MGYLPRPLPGELVSGVVMRAARHLGITVRQVTASLNGRRGRHPPFLVPCFLEAIGEETGLDAVALLMDNSLFPYLTAALSEMHTGRIARIFLDPCFDGRHAMPSTAYLQVPGVTFRCFCRQCVRADCACYGESYWHREHHLPGVTCCFKHGSPLTASGLTLCTPDSQAALLPSDLVGDRECASSVPAEVLDWLTVISVRALDAPGLLSDFPYAEAAKRRGFRWEDAYSRAQLVGAAFALVGPDLSRLIPHACWCRPPVVIPESSGPVPQWPTLIWLVIHHYLASALEMRT